MAITLFANPHSFNSRKVHWALEELGLPYAYTNVDIPKGAHKAPDFLAMNPNGRVPALQDGDLLMYESNAIMLYLAGEYGNGRLLPAASKARALVYQWLSWQASDFGPAIARPSTMKLLTMFGAPLDAAAYAAAGEAAKPVVAILENHLKGRSLMTGDQLSIADIAITETIGMMDMAGLPILSTPNIGSYFKGMSQRPAFLKTRPAG